jgi:exodeoxyribonuclease V alpha subunit
VDIFNSVVQISNVWPGSVGGAIFTVHPINNRKTVLCKASYKTLTNLPKKGEFWKVNGHMTFDKERYMNQVTVLSCHLQGLPSNQFLAAYLKSSPRFRGFNLGPKKIDKLIEKVGHESTLIALMEQNRWSHIADVINEAAARRLCEEWVKSKNETETIAFLVEHNFEPSLSKKIMKVCKEHTVKRLQDNPYNLLAFGGVMNNIFSTVEKCAQKLNIHKDDPRRLVGAVEHVMYERLKIGHTAARKSELLKDATKLLGTELRAENAIDVAISNKVICKLNDNGATLYQAIGPAYIESSFEKRMARLIKGEMQQSLLDESESKIIRQIKKYNSELQKKDGYLLVQGQIKAISMALTNRCSIITGFGGTGKTTTLRAIVDIAEDMGKKVYLMALAGKAKERIKQATGREAMTIHGFIKTATAQNKGDDKNSRNDIDLNCNPFIIIDEASMVDISLFNRLLKLFDGRSYSLLTVGDDSQLSPVGFGLAWHKMVDSMIPTTHLTEVHRQVAKSSLHRVAMQIRSGGSEVLTPWKGQIEGVYFVECASGNLRDQIVKIRKKLPNAQVLTPHMSERMPDSGYLLNKSLQAQLTNKLDADSLDSRKGFRVGRHFIYEGDPVLVTENNYDMQLFNGTLGKLVRMENNNEGEITGVFDFEGRTGSVTLTLEKCYEIGLTLAYAITIHKSQGSEFETTIISCVVKSDFVERSMMYTALTRTRKLCIIVGNRDTYNKAVASLKRSDTLVVGLEISISN